MAQGAPKGNNFWELRSKHGRDRLFATPELMWEAAVEYFQWCVDNPLIEVAYYGKEAERVEIPKIRAFTMQALCIYLDCNTVYFNHFENDIKGREDEISKGFSQIVTRIRETIYSQKFEGAAAGLLNHNIIARDLGLVDKRENDDRTKIKVSMSDSGSTTND